MSDTVVVAIITGGSTGAVGIAGLVIQFLNSSRERKLRLHEKESDNREWYARELFQRRLAAGQSLVEYFRRFEESYPHIKPGQPQSDHAKAITQTAEEVREWLRRNSIFVPRNVSDSLWGFLNNYEACLHGIPMITTEMLDAFYFPASLAVQEFELQLLAKESSASALRAEREDQTKTFLAGHGIFTEDQS